MRLRPFQSIDVIVVMAVTVLVFAYQASLGLEQRLVFEDHYAAVPSVMWDAWHAFREHGLDRQVLLAAVPLVTANYLHGGVEHLAGNMLFFWIFANCVSQVTGRAIFVTLYLLAGIVAVLVYVRTHPGSDIPMLGASGAIAGLEGAYFVFFYRWELPQATVWPLEGPQPPARLGLVALVNFALDTGAFFGHAQGGVAYAAHVGGFVGGAILAMIVATVWRPRFRPPR
jgi:membrane associated rhomboid family serine protease